MTSPHVVLMTATVTPRAGLSGLVHTDVDQRLSEYAEQLGHMVGLLDRAEISGIVFAENSGFDLSYFADIVGHRDRVELLPVDCSEDPTSMGRGYLETYLVSRAISQAQVRPLPGGLFWKVTGRYRIENMARILRRTPPGFDLHLNYWKWPNERADLWLYGTTETGIDLLRSAVDEIGAREPTEMLLPPLVERWLAEGRSVRPKLASTPRIAGIRGYDGQRHDTVLRRFKWKVRAAVRAIS